MDDFGTRVLAVLAKEFSDLTDLDNCVRLLARLLLAAVLGGLLGLQRELSGKAAGLRTHMLVCTGAALFVLAPGLNGAGPDALSRAIQGVVAGIGFLGAGTILKGNEQDTHKVKGLTTAAGLWMTAAIGVAAGMGHEGSAIFATALALLVLAVVPRSPAS
ncbi:MgtC/SapB family protein [Pseudomonas sp. KNUC1026]|uniref:MgtC/SapB family protein n=1 Tax=Pseudomonas sp. KNUC1026 TaxID=2893890 RepID=UPI001F2C7352|nr:MgtC/SapB family protein [Pseudomonas sp. KNUC1026]UFH48449.1 MgtC/SapB family protein [Pseudomonas sp. KNUC1026]